MIKCDGFIEILALGEDATPEEKAAVKAHAANCAECAAVIEAFTLVENELSTVTPTPVGFTNRVVAGLPRQKPARRESWTPVWVLTGAAYAVAILMGGAVVWFAFGNPAVITEAVNAFAAFAASPSAIGSSAFGTIAGVSAATAAVVGYFAYNLVLSAE